MKVIFLDFYGVMDGPMTRHRTEIRLDPGCAALINDIHRRTGAVVVISSDSCKEWNVKDDIVEWDPDDPEARESVRWMKGSSSYDLARGDLIECGVKPDIIIGCTYQPPSSTAMFDRPREIKDWLDAHPEVEGYVVFDDKPLPFSNKMIQEMHRDIDKWSNQRHVDRFRAALLPLDNGMDRHFILVDPREGLTRQDAEKGILVLGKKIRQR